MPYFALYYEVIDDFVARRASFRDAHLSYARAAHLRGDLVLAGALGDPADAALLIFQSPSPDAPTNFAKNDPYVLQGLVNRWHVRPWTVVVGNDAHPSQSLKGEA
jgi:uncharacterized protein YciI